MLNSLYDLGRLEHEERLRKAAQARRAEEARGHARRHTAAPAERRSFVFRVFALRPRQA
jgi:hypothetical protein